MKYAKQPYTIDTICTTHAQFPTKARSFYNLFFCFSFFLRLMQNCYNIYEYVVCLFWLHLWCAHCTDLHEICAHRSGELGQLLYNKLIVCSGYPDLLQFIGFFRWITCFLSINYFTISHIIWYRPTLFRARLLPRIFLKMFYFLFLYLELIRFFLMCFFPNFVQFLIEIERVPFDFD